MTADMDSRLAIDTAVLFLYFIVIISIGLYMGRKRYGLTEGPLAKGPQGEKNLERGSGLAMRQAISFLSFPLARRCS